MQGGYGSEKVGNGFANVEWSVREGDLVHKNVLQENQGGQRMAGLVISPLMECEWVTW